MKKQRGFAQIYIVMAVVGAMMAGGFYLYYNDSQARLQAQAQTIAAQQIKIAENDAIVEQHKEDVRLQGVISEKLGMAFTESREEVDVLREKFEKVNAATQKKRDIGKLASSRKARRIEKIINNATSNVFRCFEIASGDPLTAEEIAATKKSQANNECSTIANPNFTAK